MEAVNHLNDKVQCWVMNPHQLIYDPEKLATKARIYFIFFYNIKGSYIFTKGTDYINSVKKM